MKEYNQFWIKDFNIVIEKGLFTGKGFISLSAIRRYDQVLIHVYRGDLVIKSIVEKAVGPFKKIDYIKRMMKQIEIAEEKIIVMFLLNVLTNGKFA